MKAYECKYFIERVVIWDKHWGKDCPNCELMLNECPYEKKKKRKKRK